MITKNEIKLIKSLSYSKHRNKNKKFTVEGFRICKEFIDSGHRVCSFIVTEHFLNKNPIFFKQSNTPSIIRYKVISENDFKQIQNTKNSQGIIGIVPFLNSSIKTNNIDGNILVLDSISDPGNMGTLMRSAVWFGVENIFFTNNCVDQYNPKVIRAAMGAHFYLTNSLDVTVTDLLGIIDNNQHILLAATMNGKSYKTIKNQKKWALILGNEAHGVDKKLLNKAKDNITIPQLGSIESLNVAVAGSILLDRLSSK